jgi:hypothetical protein
VIEKEILSLKERIKDAVGLINNAEYDLEQAIDAKRKRISEEEIRQRRLIEE